MDGVLTGGLTVAVPRQAAAIPRPAAHAPSAGFDLIEFGDATQRKRLGNR